MILPTSLKTRPLNLLRRNRLPVSLCSLVALGSLTPLLASACGPDCKTLKKCPEPTDGMAGEGPDGSGGLGGNGGADGGTSADGTSSSGGGKPSGGKSSGKGSTGGSSGTSGGSDSSSGGDGGARSGGDGGSGGAPLPPECEDISCQDNATCTL
jgi:hypothetical protein